MKDFFLSCNNKRWWDILCQMTSIFFLKVCTIIFIYRKTTKKTRIIQSSEFFFCKVRMLTFFPQCGKEWMNEWGVVEVDLNSICNIAHTHSHTLTLPFSVCLYFSFLSFIRFVSHENVTAHSFSRFIFCFAGSKERWY
jgi:hypothetical protein